MPKRSGLSEREVRFALGFARTGNATQAYLAAGYKPGSTPAATGAAASSALKRPEVAALVAEEQAVLRRRLDVDGMRVATELAALALSDVTRLLNDDGTIKPVSQWHALTRLAVKSYTVKVVGSTEEGLVIEKRVTMHDKWGPLQYLAKLAGFKKGNPGGLKGDRAKSGRGPAVRVLNPDGSEVELAGELVEG